LSISDKSILFVDQFREVTGGQVVLQSLVKVTREAGYRVGVLAPMGGGLERALEERWGDQVARHDLHELSLQSGRKGWRDAVRLLGFGLYLLKFLRLVSRYEIVYVNGGRLALPFALLSLLTFRTRWIYHLHLCHSGLEKRLLSFVARSPRTSRVVLASRFILEDFARQQPEVSGNSRICVVENCLNLPFTGLPFVDRFSTGDARLTVALIGRISPVKGHAVLPGLARALPELDFTFIGRAAPDQGAFLQALLADAPSNLSYSGESPNLPSLIDLLPVHISIVPSRWEEPFGLVSIESMAASCLTLVSDRGMLPHIAARTGAWCFHDDEELAAMLARLSTMPRAELKNIAENQHASVNRLFGFDDFRRTILRVISQETDSDSSVSGGLHPTLAA
jgi:glycosyltransferase involved in cell wall biosynthesis